MGPVDAIKLVDALGPLVPRMSDAPEEAWAEAASIRRVALRTRDQEAKIAADRLLSVMASSHGKYKELLWISRSLIRDAPDDACAWLALGNAHEELGAWGEAHAAYLQARKLAEANPKYATDPFPVPHPSTEFLLAIGEAIERVAGRVHRP